MSKPRILFADDSATIQQVFEFAFENEEIDVTLASSGQEAFEKAKALMPDMVIADVNMPDGDGFKLCQLIKSDPSLSSTPVYLLSSSLEEFDEEKAQEIGADGHFNKPFKSEEILEKVRKVIAEIPKQANTTKDDDTFDDIDVSIDSILEGIGETSEIDEAPHNPKLDEIESAVEEALSSSHVLDLGAEVKVETEPDEDDLSVEVISGEEISLDTNFEGMETLEADIDIGDDVAIDKLSETEFSIAGDAELDEIAPSEIIDGAFSIQEGGSSLMERKDDEPVVRDEEIVDALDGGEIEIEDDIEIEINPIPDSQIIENVKAKAEQELSKAVTDALGDIQGKGIDETINEAIKEAVAEKLKSNEMEKLLASVVQSAMDEMKPQMLSMLKKVAQDMTLDVAEDMVKQTIDQIKNEK